jgi:hypothetical protein
MVRNLDLHDSNRRFRNDGLVGETGRVKKLELFESNHGCGLNVPSQGRYRNGRNITLQGPELVRNVFQKPLGAAGSSPVVSVGSSILTTRDFDQILGVVRRWLRRNSPRRTLVGTVNDMCAIAALRAFEEAGAGQLCAVIGQNAIREARNELRRPGTRLIGTVAYFPERYGDELIPLALSMLEHKAVPPATFVKHQLLTAKNVDLVYPLDLSGGISTRKS